MPLLNDLKDKLRNLLSLSELKLDFSGNKGEFNHMSSGEIGECIKDLQFLERLDINLS